MSNFVIILCYILVAYGACNVIAFGDGPFYVFSRIRQWANNISEHFGKVFSCMMCLPANFGWICSLVNWFCIPVAFTPFNIIFAGHTELWWLAALCDGALTTGIVYLIFILNEYLEKRITFYEQNTIIDENDIEGYDSASIDEKKFLVEDITLKKDNDGKQ